ncbi:MAG TPA: dolichyl-phosphate beta-glucosyltransferase [Planktothrix sp.]|jgi:dolichyl-phosphate beta-glucosyltransferase
MPKVSVIIPAYNEEKRLPPTLSSVWDYWQQRGEDFEIIVVDDGSGDHTTDIVQDFGKHHENVRLISYAPNQGKGYAVRTGMLSAYGDYLLIDDADGASPIEEVERLESAIASGADIAIGSRNIPEAGTKIQTVSYRKHMGNTFNLIVQSLLLPGIRDTQCGFKLFKSKVAQDLFGVSAQNGFAYDVEVLFIARLRGYKIAEVAINWTNVEGSKVNVISDSLNMLVQVLFMRIAAIFGAYRKNASVNPRTPLPMIHIAPKSPEDETTHAESESQI